MTILLKIKYIVCVAICVCFFFFSCEDDGAYHQFQSVEKASWSKNDSLNFVVDTTSILPGIAYDIRIETVNDAKFPYQNLWLFVRSNMGGEKIFRQDTLQIKLADMYGKWTGAGFGSYYQNTIVLRKRVIFSQKRNYTFQIIQGMRDEPLMGIEKVGLRVSHSE